MKELLGAATDLVRSVRSHRKSRDEIEVDYLNNEDDVDSDDRSIADEKDGGQTKELNNYLEFYETLQNTFQHQPMRKDPPFLKRSKVGSPLNDDELVSAPL